MFSFGFKIPPLHLPAGGFDEDAQALFDAIEAEDGAYLSSVQKTETDTLIKGFKSEGIWDKIDFWPLMGGNAAGAKHDFKLNFPITWGADATDIVFSYYGFHPDGTTDCYGDTGWIPSVQAASVDSVGMACHATRSRVTGSNHGPMGSSDASSNRFRILAQYTASAQSFGQIGGGNTNDVVYTIAPSDYSFGYGDHMIMRQSSSSMRYVVDGVSVNQRTTGLINDLSTISTFIGCTQSSGGTPQFNMSGRISYAAQFNEALSDAEITAYYTLIKAWLVGMDRYIVPELYSGFDQVSEDNKFIEAYSVSAEEAGMTPAIFAKLVNLHALHQGGTDGLVNLVNPGTFNASLVNAPAMQADGAHTDRTGANHVNMGINMDDFTDETDIFFLTYAQNELPSGNRWVWGYSVSGSDRLWLRSIANGSDVDLSFVSNGSVTTLETITAGTTYGCFGINSYDRGTGKKVQAFINQSMIGVEATINATSSTTDFYLGDANGASFGVDDGAWSVSIHGEGLTDAEALIVSDWIERAMVKLGLSKLTNPIPTEVETYLEEILADSSVTIQSQEQKAKNFLIQELVNSGDWAELDLFTVLGTIEQSNNNVIHDLIQGTTLGGSVVNAPAYDIEGGESTGTEYQTTGFIRNTHGSGASEDDQSMMGEIISVGASTSLMAGNKDADTNSRHWLEQESSTDKRINLACSNANGITFSSAAAESSIIAGVRSSDSLLEAYKDGVKVGENTSTVTTTDTLEEDIIMGISNNGSPLSASGGTKMGFFARGTKDVNQENINTIWTNYKRRLKGYEIALAF